MSDTPNTPQQGAIVPAAQADKWLKVIETNKSEFQKALGSAIPVEFFNRVAITSVRKTPLLAQCSPQSLIGELMSCAQIHLVPDGVTGEAYLVPFYNSQLKCYEAKLMIGYKGLVKIIRRNNDVLNLTADVVFENDVFVYRKGTRHELSHEPLIRGDRGPMIGAYAYIAYKNGGADFHFTDSAYIERVKASSKGSDKPDSPWNVWPESMWCKTAIKQLAKLADLSPQTREAISKDLDLGSIDVVSTVSHAAATTEQSRLLRDENPAGDDKVIPLQNSPAAPEPKPEPEQKPKATPAPKPAAAPAEKAPATAPAAAKPAPAPQAAKPAPQPPAAAPKPAAAPFTPTVKPAAPAPKPAKKPTLVEQPVTAEDLARENEEYMRKMGMTQAKPAPAAPEPEPNDEGDPFAAAPTPARQGEAQLGDTLFPED